jgi:polyisoprenoid-binding protein YceI
MAVGLTSGAPARGQTVPQFVIVSPESRVEFYVNCSIMEVYGVFKDWEGKVDVPTGRPTEAFLKLEMKSGSISTGSGRKDHVVKGEHFFWVEKYPSVTFVSKGVVPTSDPLKFTMNGDFTLRGVTKPVTLQITLDPEGKGKWQIYGDLSFDRREFGMTYNMPFVRISDTVRVRIDLQVMAAPGKT